MSYRSHFINALRGDQTALDRLHQTAFDQYSEGEFRERFEIYATSIFASYERALNKTYRPFVRLLGKETAESLFALYAKQHFSLSDDLNVYGQSFGIFLEKTVPWFSAFPYLKDFARFCWDWQQVFVENKGPTLIQSAFPLYEIWTRCQPEYQGEMTLPPASKKRFCYVLLKKNERVRVFLLSNSLKWKEKIHFLEEAYP